MYIAIATRYRKNLINFTMAESIGSLRTNIIAIKPMNVITNWAHRRAMARRHRCDHHTFNSRSFVTGRIVILISCIQRQRSPDAAPCATYGATHCWVFLCYKITFVVGVHIIENIERYLLIRIRINTLGVRLMNIDHSKINYLSI